jgi:hypothetical protein
MEWLKRLQSEYFDVDPRRSIGLKEGEFFHDWFYPFWLFLIYFVFRGYAYEWGSSLGFELVSAELVALESKLFFFMEQIPPVYIQEVLKPDPSIVYWYDYLFTFFYFSFYWFWILVAYLLWKDKRELFKTYIYGILGLSLFSCIIYIFLPTAPPWAAAQVGLLPPLERTIWTVDFLPNTALDFALKYGKNSYAALPSLHTAWPLFASIFLIKAYGQKMLPVLIIPIMVAFSTWYGAEHYVIDSIAGALLVFATIYWLNVKGTELLTSES